MLTAHFLKVPEGALFLSVHTPDGPGNPRGWVIHVPAFAEEMNKARPMVNRQARQLAAHGFAVVVPDLYGTGDSSGEFGEALWQRWQQDMACVVGWLVEQGGQGICLWGLRLGCLLALDVARAHGDHISRLILWQPVQAGQPFMTRFLRLQMTANFGEGADNSPTSLRSRLSEGASIEVGGYLLSPQLVSEVDAKDATALVPPASVRTSWLEISSAAEPCLLAASTPVIDSWKGEGVLVDCQVVKGDSFWATQEIAMVPGLLEATADIVCGSPEPDVQPVIAVRPDHRTSTLYRDEQALVFDCQGDELVGVLHRGSMEATTALVIVVGGPQYRIGSHRQFVAMARQFSEAGVPVLRFDYRGMGDSAGVFTGFEGVADDIASAVDALQRLAPGIERVVLLGLCDAATAAAFYAPTDERIAGLVLMNPWVRSERGQARAYLRHYYLGRLLDPRFWRKIAGGQFRPLESMKSLKNNLLAALKPASAGTTEIAEQGTTATAVAQSADIGHDLIGRMYRALKRFHQPVLLILSGRDLTADEFQDASGMHAGFRRLLSRGRFEKYHLPEADHTFSRRIWQNQAVQRILQWVRAL